MEFLKQLDRIYLLLDFVLMQRVQALTLRPSKRVHCKFGNNLTIEARMLCERLIVRA